MNSACFEASTEKKALVICSASESSAVTFCMPVVGMLSAVSYCAVSLQSI